MIVAIIPARGGSKRIKGKNIKSFCGKPIICNNFNEDINDIINNNNIGLIHNFSLENISDIKSFILNTKNNEKISSRCINFANNNLELKIATNYYLKIYKEVNLE